MNRRPPPVSRATRLSRPQIKSGAGSPPQAGEVKPASRPWIAGFSALLLAGSALLWFGRPADSSSIVPVLAAFALGAVGAQCALVFFNSMMPSLVPSERIGRLSGTAWGVA